MSDALSEATDSLAAVNEDGTLYLAAGVAMAFVAWFLLPLAGLVSVYCGYELARDHERTIAGAVIGGAGAVAVLSWLVFVLFLL